MRLRRLRGARTYVSNDLGTNVDIDVPTQPQASYSTAALVPRTTGGSKIRRPASNWTDYLASQTADIVYKSQNLSNPNAKVLETIRLCDCLSPIRNYDGVIDVGTNITVNLTTGKYKLYTFTPTVSGTYVIRVIDPYYESVPDLFVSHPDRRIDIEYDIQNDNRPLTGVNVTSSILYANNIEGFSAITGDFLGGKKYEVLVYQYHGNRFELTVQPRVYEASIGPGTDLTVIIPPFSPPYILPTRVFRFDPPFSGLYTLSALPVGGGPTPTIFISYPCGGIDEHYIDDNGYGGGSTQYGNGDLGISTFTVHFDKGQIYEVAVSATGFDATYRLTVTV